MLLYSNASKSHGSGIISSLTDSMIFCSTWGVCNSHSDTRTGALLFCSVTIVSSTDSVTGVVLFSAFSITISTASFWALTDSLNAFLTSLIGFDSGISSTTESITSSLLVSWDTSLDVLPSGLIVFHLFHNILNQSLIVSVSHSNLSHFNSNQLL